MNSNHHNIVKESPIPLYYQIYVDLKTKLLSNMVEMKEDKLPTEMELAKKYNVSRVCMRQAMAELEKDGIIVRYRSKGTFLNHSPKPIMHNLELPSSTREQSVRQYIDKCPEVVELSCFEITFPHISAALTYEGRIYYIKRIMKVDGNPIAVNRIWIPACFAPGLEAGGLSVEGSLSKTLDQVYHLKPHRRENIVEALRPTGSEVDLLKITYDTLILQITSTSFNEADVAYEYSETSWIGDAIRLKMEITDIEHGLQFSQKS